LLPKERDQGNARESISKFHIRKTTFFYVDSSDIEKILDERKRFLSEQSQNTQ